MTILSIFVSLFASWAMGNKLVSTLLDETSHGARLIRMALAIGVGLAATSVCLFFWLLANHGNATYYPASEAVFATILLAFAFSKGQHKPASKCETEVSDTQQTAVMVLERKTTRLFWALFIMAVGSVTLFSFSLPHGKWDAWAIWNMRARFIFRAGENWTTAFSDKIAFSHPDYPLMLPLSVTKGWLYSGSETLASPMITGIAFSAALLLLLYGAVLAMRGPVAGIFAAAALTSTPLFIEMSASQYADVPISFFFLATLVLISMYTRKSRPGLLMLAGITAGFAAWTKNEGLLFVSVVTVFVISMALRRKDVQSPKATLTSYFSGLVPALLPVAIFKIFLAPPNDLVLAFTTSQQSPLLDIERYTLIAFYMCATAASFGKWTSILFGAFNPLAIMTAYLCWAGVQLRSRDNRVLPGILIAMIGGYFFAYLTSPHELKWHLETSCNRLFLQLWPGAIFAFFLLAGEDER